jgi:murein DD-endopeptidase MepM/ murein hydrolase activator NlpD
MPAGSCVVCGRSIAGDVRLVLVRGKRHAEHCSEACLRDTVRKQRRARLAARARWFLRLSAVALLLAGANAVWQRFGAPHPQSISFEPPQLRPAPAPSGPPQYGPAWPPTDDDWLAAFRKVSWTYPLPGPIRRTPVVDARMFGIEVPGARTPLCREPGQCAVDLGGELWGEHVYAALDGVVDRVRRAGGDERGGEFVRIAHLGGLVFTQYFHLAAIPRGIARGVQVKAGEVVGLLGDTGVGRANRHLYFSLSTWPSLAFSETYWDPRPLMALWPLRVPAHGTVAGFAPADADIEPPRRHASLR